MEPRALIPALCVVLALSTCAGAVEFGLNDQFMAVVRENLAAEHAAWMHHQKRTEGAEHHVPGMQFVQSHESQFAGGMNLDGSCDPGLTGPLCMNPICSGRVPLTPHNNNDSYGEAIELGTSMDCSLAFKFPVDSYMTNLILAIYSPSNAMPRATLVSPAGHPIMPDNIDSGDVLDAYNAFFANIQQNGRGYFEVQLSSMSDLPCSYTVMATTSAEFDAGFVESVNDDNIQMHVYEPWKLLRNPTFDRPSFLAAMISGVPSPGSAQAVSFYAGDVLQYPPQPLTLRYGCSATLLSPLYICQQEGFYKAKFTGYDGLGNVFQRMYTFECTGVAPTGGPPPTTPPPPDDCYNGGTMITNGLNNKTCLCGLYYAGNYCEKKLCYNDGFLTPDGYCKCPEGYSGNHCTDIMCKSPAYENFDTQRRALVFVVRTSSSFAPYIAPAGDTVHSVLYTANLIVGYAAQNNPGYYRSYVLIGYANNALTYVNEFDDAYDFYEAIKALPNNATNSCTDSLYAAVGAALTTESVKKYQRSPVFTFGDNLPSDPENQESLFDALSYFQGQIFNIILYSANSQCPINIHDPAYRELRRLAQFSHGLVSTLPSGNFSETAFNLAVGVEGKVYLAMNDFVDQCSLGSKYTSFFVDDSTGWIGVLATGNSISIKVRNTANQIMTPNSVIQNGNSYVLAFKSLIKGNYLLEVSADGNSPCQFRVVGDSKYDLFLGTTTDVRTDLYSKQPRLNELTNIVTRVNHVAFANPSEAFAEIIVWTHDHITGNRTVLYAGNGIYRDGCDYHFYFERFLCARRNMLFYISVFLTDKVGYTIQRVRSAVCAAPYVVPTSPDGCQNGGAIDHTGTNNRTCVCPVGWTGDRCQTIVCQNGATNKLTYCQCRAGYSGQFCEIIGCYAQAFDDHSFNRRSLTFLVHDSFTTRGMIINMQKQMAQTIQDVSQQHPRWINQYVLVTFDGQTVGQRIRTSDPAAFLASFAKFAAENDQTTSSSCKDLPILQALYLRLSDASSERFGLYYVFLNGVMHFDGRVFDQVQVLLETTQSQVNFVEADPLPCGYQLTDNPPGFMWSIAALTGGQVFVVSLPNSGYALKTLPLQYRSGFIYEKFVPDCSAGYDFIFPVDSEMQSANILIDGDLALNPVYTYPNGTTDQYLVQNVYTDWASSSRLDQLIGQCDNDWRSLENRCWRFFASLSSWDDAKATCAKNNAVLATIFDSTVQQYLYSKTGPTTFWTGLNDRDALGSFVWDQGSNNAIPLSSIPYTNWGAQQPNVAAGQCVSDNKANHWTVANCSSLNAFACVKHAYDVDYDPTSASTSKIFSGFWSVNVKTFSGGCAVMITGQSGIQVFPEYTNDVHQDFGGVSPLSGNFSNYLVSHVTGVSSFTENNGGSLQYVHMYTTTRNMTMSNVVRAFPRDLKSCSHQFVSEPFTCPSSIYQILLTGVDQYGYAFQRIKPTLCYDTANTTCQNGGVFYNNKCVCPPQWGGQLCQMPFCVNGRLAANLVSCDCTDEPYTGVFCETPICTNGTSNLPPDTNQNKTFILVLDGSYSNGMEGVLSNLQPIISQILKNASVIDNGWFTDYVGIIAFDSAYTSIYSQIVHETNIDTFIHNLAAQAAGASYVSNNRNRALFGSLGRVLALSTIQHRSIAYIVSAGAAEDPQLMNPVLDLVAISHTAVNFIFIGDKAAPSGLQYYDPQVDACHEVAVLTGGGFYQVPDHIALVAFWWGQLITQYNSYLIVLEGFHNCSKHTTYIQVGANNFKLLFDIFSMVKVSIQIYDNTGTLVPVTSVVMSTGTNFLFSLTPAVGKYFSPGVYKLQLTSTSSNDHPFCTMAVSGITQQPVYTAFTQELGWHNGEHSNQARWYPQDNMRNAIVSDATFGMLQYAQIYDVRDRSLLWASQFQIRSNCNFHFITLDNFSCPAASFTVAIDGVDDDGHPYRRIEIDHCVGAAHNITKLEAMPHSFGHLMAAL